MVCGGEAVGSVSMIENDPPPNKGEPCGVLPETNRGGEAVTDPFDIIHEGCWVGLRLGLQISATTGNLKVVEGVYGFAAGKNYHPLEAALLCAPALGDWLLDLATTLGVEAEWVRGFIDSFAQEPETSR